MRLKMGIRIFAIASLTATLMVGFQNCDSHTNAKFASPSSPAAQQNGGGGTGYDGKVYTSQLMTGVCPDGSVVRAKIIVLSATGGQLVRDNCQDISPPLNISGNFTVDAINPDFLVYSGNTFTVQIVSNLLIEGSNSTTTGLTITSNDANSVGQYAFANLNTYSSNAGQRASGVNFSTYPGTAANPAPSLPGYWLGFMTFYGSDSAGVARAAAWINVQADSQMTATSAPGSIHFATSSVGSTYPTDKMMISSAGNVGIGNSAPSYKLDVNGTIRGYGITDSSDARLKSDIVPLSPEQELERVLRLRAVSYNWSDPNRDRAKQIGFIAQELEVVFPELVSTGKDGFKSVNYSHMVSPLTGAVQSLHNEISKLKEENAALKKRLDDIEAMLRSR